MGKVILALDLGTKTGYALSNGVSGVKDLKTDRHEGAGMRYLRFERWLGLMNYDHMVDEIYYEEVRRHAGTQASHVYGGLQATLTKFCEEKLIPYQSVPVGTIKKHATGYGNASKEMMISAAKELGYKVEDDNAADAIHLLRYVQDILIGGVSE